MAALKTLRPRLGSLPTTLQTVNPGSWRSTKTKTADRGYGGAWQRARLRHLSSQPLCVMCEQEQPSRVTVATVVDHRVPHRGDMSMFWDESNWQSLCAHHHSSHKQRQESEEEGGVSISPRLRPA